MKIEIKLDNEDCMPTRAHQWDAGMDLRSTNNHNIPPGRMCLVDTGVSIKIPIGYVGLVFSRSSMGKSQVSLANAVGVIDESYRGNIKIMVQNNNPDSYYNITKSDRIAQLVIVPMVVPDLLVYSGSDDQWKDSTRGEGGFGSTGK